MAVASGRVVCIHIPVPINNEYCNMYACNILLFILNSFTNKYNFLEASVV